MSTVIRIDNLSKKYTIGHKNSNSNASLRDAISEGAKRINQKLVHPVSRNSEQLKYFTSEEFWALKNVSLDIKQGDRLGIIGRNGAGKSTLLKILSRITEPTSGEVIMKGRVASLLEVGTGFHPELTGRENIFLNGAILGMGKTEIKNKFDEIVAFAEVEKFLDTPVKRYSSGMYVRLAFAIAAHLEPQILIVDEVLAVGDAQFQKKCMGKMNEVSTEGRTILFVSHNMTAVTSLCNKAILLEGGKIIDSGDAREVVTTYLANDNPEKMQQIWKDPRTAPGNDFVRLLSAKIYDSNNIANKHLTIDTSLALEFVFSNLHHHSSLNFSIQVFNDQGVCVFSTASDPASYPVGKVTGTCSVPGNLLNDGNYKVRIQIIRDASSPLLKIDEILSFNIHDIAHQRVWYGKWIGVVRPNLKWDTSFSETVANQ